MRSSSAGTRRFRLLWAARSSLRWRGRDCSPRCRWPGGACPIACRPAGPGCSRGPSLLSSAVVSTSRGPLTAADCSGRVPVDVGSHLIPRVPVEVGHGRPESARVPPSPVPACRPPDAEACFEAARPASAPLPWPSPGVHGSALLCPVRVHLTARQGSRQVTASWVAPPARRETPLQHPRSPRSPGSRRRGALALTTTGLTPASRR
jgi:hypothetical protein